MSTQQFVKKLERVINVQENDIKQLKKIKCYKGIRHIQNLPVRGQSTKAHFRKRGNRALGVKKAKGSKKSSK